MIVNSIYLSSSSNIIYINTYQYPRSSGRLKLCDKLIIILLNLSDVQDCRKEGMLKLLFLFKKQNWRIQLHVKNPRCFFYHPFLRNLLAMTTLLFQICRRRWFRIFHYTSKFFGRDSHCSMLSVYVNVAEYNFMRE